MNILARVTLAAIHFSLFAGLYLAQAGIPSAGATPADGHGVKDQAAPTIAYIPFSMNEIDHIVVHATMIGTAGQKVPLKLIVDTGATMGLLRPETVAKLGLPSVPATDNNGKKFISPMGSTVVTASGIELTGQAGDVELPGYRMLVLSNKAMLPALGNDIDGILGGDLFWGEPFLIDWEKEVIEVPNHQPKDSQALLLLFNMAGATQIPITVAPQGYVCEGTAIINKKRQKVPMVIDTGYSSTKLSLMGGVTSAIKGNIPSFKGQASLVAIGKLPTAVSFNGISQASTLTYQPLSILGIDTLKRYRILFDFARGSIYAQPWQTKIYRSSLRLDSSGLLTAPAHAGETFVGNFPLDTTVNYSWIKQSTLNKMLSHILQSGFTNQSEGSNPVKYVVLDSIMIGSLPLRHQLFYVFDDISDATFRGPAAGRIGTDVLNDFSLMVDYARHQMAFIDSSQIGTAQLSQIGMAQSKRLDLLPAPTTGYYFMPFHLTSGPNAATTSILLDIQGTETTIFHTTASSLKLKGQAAQASQAASPMLRSHIDTAQTGSFKLHGLDAYYPAGSDAGNPPPATSGRIFSSLFSRVLFDFRDNCIYGVAAKK